MEITFEGKAALVTGAAGGMGLAAAMKFAEAQILSSVLNEPPILFLDDVMSELDDDRRQYLLNLVKKNEIQTIITGANIEMLTEEIAKDEIFSIQEGKIIK